MVLRPYGVAELIGDPQQPPRNQATNWAGYAASGAAARFERVTATWIVAPGSCRAGRRSYSAAWVGLGGYHSNAKALEQTGTDANRDAAGGAHHTAW
jgi:hypothetical protein